MGIEGVEICGEQSFEEDYRLRAKLRLRKESRRGKACPESVGKSANAKRNAGLGMEATLTGRELHES